MLAWEQRLLTYFYIGLIIELEAIAFSRDINVIKANVTKAS